MAESFKVLGQVNPAAATPTKLYTVPGSTSTVVSTLVVCNQGGSPGTFRVSIRIGGEGDDPKQYLFFESVVNASAVVSATLGITLAATDEIWVQASSTDFSFNAFGDEIT